MSKEPGKITLIHTSSGWHARFEGPVAETIRMAFGTATIPTAFTAEASAAQVKRDIAAKWTRCVVRLQSEVE